MESIRVDLKNNGYPINIGVGILDEIKKLSSKNKWMVITDENIDKLYGKDLDRLLSEQDTYKYVLDPGEESKTPEMVVNILTELMRKNFTRHDKILAFGGGVIGDLAGFCAATYMRGISFVQIPTTLLAQVDSSVGGKTGVNLPEAKNIMGAFHQPELVIADTSLLKSLPPREMMTGLGEVIKYGLIEDYVFFQYINSNLKRILEADQEILPSVVKECCKIKARIVTEDEKERGLRKNLNFGHTIGHSIETSTGYKKYTHGEAVIIGMYYETKLAHSMGFIDDEYLNEITTCLKETGVSLNLDWASNEDLVKIMGRDKKNQNSKISFILPTGKGQVEEFLITEDNMLKLFSQIMEG